MKTKLTFILGIIFVVFQNSAQSEPLRIEVVGDDSEVIFQNMKPTPTPLPGATFKMANAGAGYSRNGESSGGYVDVSTQGISGNEDENRSSLQFQNFAFHVDLSHSKNSASYLGVGGEMNLFLGASGLKQHDGLGLYAGGLMQGTLYASANQTRFGQGVLGPEAGVHLRKKGVTVTVGGSVSVGGQGCYAVLEDGKAISLTGSPLAYSGIARLVLRDNLYMDVIYTRRNSHDTHAESDEAHGSSESSSLNGTVVIGIGKTIALSGRCVINNIRAPKETEDQLGREVYIKNNLLQIGIVKRLGWRRK